MAKIGGISAAGRRLKEHEATIDGVSVMVIKLEDDPMCLRASLGGDPTAGYYLTYRGDVDAIRHLLDTARAALEASEGGKA